jgi:SAM-dependent methyltransferase
MAEWFEAWFGEEYVELYPHRDEAEAERLVVLLRRTIPWRRGWRVLDVGCGAGRYLAVLARHGVSPVGVDLSATLLRRARNFTDAPLIRADMRFLPVRPGSMDLTLNLFTSFGYFHSDAQHEAALSGMLATVRAGGWFVMDFLDADWVRATLVPHESVTLAGHPAVVERRITPDGLRVEKTIRLADGRSFEESVRLLSAGELEAMIHQHGGRVAARFGNYEGGPVGPGPRVIFVAEAR